MTVLIPDPILRMTYYNTVNGTSFTYRYDAIGILRKKKRETLLDRITRSKDFFLILRPSIADLQHAKSLKAIIDFISKLDKQNTDIRFLEIAAHSMNTRISNCIFSRIRYEIQPTELILDKFDPKDGRRPGLNLFCFANIMQLIIKSPSIERLSYHPIDYRIKTTDAFKIFYLTGQFMDGSNRISCCFLNRTSAFILPRIGLMFLARYELVKGGITNAEINYFLDSDGQLSTGFITDIFGVIDYEEESSGLL